MKLRPFEAVLVVVFLILAIAALVLLSTFSGKKEDPEEGAFYVGKVQIWGTLPAEQMNTFLNELTSGDKVLSDISYKFITAENFDEELTKAIADGVGPDLIFTSHENLVEQRRRIKPISYESFPLRDLQTNYLDGAKVFALSDGIYGYPMFVDPMMMFWNRDILTNAGFLSAPATWEELINVQFPKLIDKDFDRTINRSVVAMGEYSNVRNAFGIISTLLLQSGSVGVTEEQGEYTVRLQSAVSGDVQPLRNSLDFYLRFSKPSNALYSWNRSFDEDRAQFISEDLAFYFGYGSEGRTLERLNPNLNFDIAEVPQGASADTRRTYARVYGLSPLSNSDNLAGAFGVISKLGESGNAKKLADSYGMVPALRVLVSQGSNDTYGNFTYKSAPIGFGWLSPQIVGSENVFGKAVSSINENKSSLETAAIDISQGLTNLYR